MKLSKVSCVSVGMILLLTMLFGAPVNASSEYATGTLEVEAVGVVLATCDYTLVGYPNLYVFMGGMLTIHQSYLLEVRVWIRIMEWYGWWIFGWWDFSNDWDPSSHPTVTFKKPSARSYAFSTGTFDKKPGEVIHYKVAACLSVDYYTFWGLYETKTNFWEYDWYL